MLQYPAVKKDIICGVSDTWPCTKMYLIITTSMSLIFFPSGFNCVFVMSQEVKRDYHFDAVPCQRTVRSLGYGRNVISFP